MGLLNAFNSWMASRHEKYLTDMESYGKCPDCRGTGFFPHSSIEFHYYEPPECIGCNGSGLYTDWSSTR